MSLDKSDVGEVLEGMRHLRDQLNDTKQTAFNLSHGNQKSSELFDALAMEIDEGLTTLQTIIDHVKIKRNWGKTQKKGSNKGGKKGKGYDPRPRLGPWRGPQS